MTHVSPDGAWRWDGRQWVPNNPPPSSGSGPFTQTWPPQNPHDTSFSYQQPMTSAEEASSASWAHYGPLIAIAVSAVLWLSIVGWGLAWLGIFTFAIPLIIRQGQGARSRFVREHATESLNFQLTCLLVGFAAGVLMVIPAILTLGLALLLLFPLMIGYTIFMIVVMAKAGGAAKTGRSYRYPLTIRFLPST